MIDDIKNFPTFVLSVLVGLLRAAISEVEVFLISLLAIAVGFATSALLGAITFLSVYVTFRMISQVAGLFAGKIDVFLRMKNNG